MAAPLPYSRVVEVTITFQSQPIIGRGFGTILILTKDSVAGQVDATNRTKQYSSMDEVASDWAVTSEPYRAAQAVFLQAPRPRTLKIGHYDTANVNAIAGELALIAAYDNDWYWLVTTRELFDTAAQDDIAAWIETSSSKCIYLADTKDPLTHSLTDTTCVAARLKTLQRRRTGVFFHHIATSYFAAGLAAYAASRNLDRSSRAVYNNNRRQNAGNAYTAAFKKIVGLAPTNLTYAAHEIITGFVPATGLVNTAGKFANTYVNMGGRDFTLYGCTASGEFIDVIHFADWIESRIQEAIVQTLTSNAVIPYTNEGQMTLVAGGVIAPLQKAQNAGFIEDWQDDNGVVHPPFEIEQDMADTAPAAMRLNRIGPDIKVCMRMSSAIHWTSIALNGVY